MAFARSLADELALGRQSGSSGPELSSLPPGPLTFLSSTELCKDLGCVLTLYASFASMYENPLESSCSYLDPAATVTPMDWMWEATSFVATTIRFGSVVIRVSS